MGVVVFNTQGSTPHSSWEQPFIDAMANAGHNVIVLSDNELTAENMPDADMLVIRAPGSNFSAHPRAGFISGVQMPTICMSRHDSANVYSIGSSTGSGGHQVYVFQSSAQHELIEWYEGRGLSGSISVMTANYTSQRVWGFASETDFLWSANGEAGVAVRNRNGHDRIHWSAYEGQFFTQQGWDLFLATVEFYVDTWGVQSDYPDLYRDFVYARTVQEVAPTHDEIFIDDLSRFPSNEAMANSNFYVTIESDLGTGNFEIVRVLETNIQNSSMLVERTDPRPHPAYTLVKAALTSDMLARVRGMQIMTKLPERLDTEWITQGTVVWHVGDHTAYILLNVDGELQWVPTNDIESRRLDVLSSEFKTVAVHAARSIARLEQTLYDPPSMQVVLTQIAREILDISDGRETMVDHSRALMKLAQYIGDSRFNVFMDDEVQNGDTPVFDGEKWTGEPVGMNSLAVAIALGG